MKYLIILLFIFYANVKEYHFFTSRKIVNIETAQDTCFNYSISVMKKWESFRGEKYELFGDHYIGYGHLIRKSDKFTYLTEIQADSLLKSDFSKAMKTVNRILPKLPKRKKLVCSMFVFNCGIGTFRKSELFRMIKNKEPDSIIEKQYMKYVFAGKRHLPKMKLRRIDEFKLYQKH